MGKTCLFIFTEGLDVKVVAANFRHFHAGFCSDGNRENLHLFKNLILCAKRKVFHPKKCFGRMKDRPLGVQSLQAKKKAAFAPPYTAGRQVKGIGRQPFL